MLPAAHPGKYSWSRGALGCEPTARTLRPPAASAAARFAAAALLPSDGTAEVARDDVRRATVEAVQRDGGPDRPVRRPASGVAREKSASPSSRCPRAASFT